MLAQSAQHQPDSSSAADETPPKLSTVTARSEKCGITNNSNHYALRIPKP